MIVRDHQGNWDAWDWLKAMDRKRFDREAAYKHVTPRPYPSRVVYAGPIGGCHMAERMTLLRKRIEYTARREGVKIEIVEGSVTPTVEHHARAEVSKSDTGERPGLWNLGLSSLLGRIGITR